MKSQQMRDSYSSVLKAIVEGRQPAELTANILVRVKNLPIDWASQREALGFPADRSRTVEIGRRDSLRSAALFRSAALLAVRNGTRKSHAIPPKEKGIHESLD